MRYSTGALAIVAGVAGLAMGTSCLADVQRSIVAMTGDGLGGGQHLDAFGSARLSQSGEVLFVAGRVIEPGLNATCETAIPTGLGVTLFELPNTNPQGLCAYPYAAWYTCYLDSAGTYFLELLWADTPGIGLGERHTPCTGPSPCVGSESSSVQFTISEPGMVFLAVAKQQSTPLRRTGAFRLRKWTSPPANQSHSSDSEVLVRVSDGELLPLIIERAPTPFDDQLTVAGIDSFAFAGEHAAVVMAPRTTPEYIRSRLALVGLHDDDEETHDLLAIDEVPVDTTWLPDVLGDASVCEVGQFAWLDADGRGVHYGGLSVLAGAAVPGIDGVTFDYLEHPSQSRSGHVVFKGRIAGDGATLDVDNAVVVRDVGFGVQVVLRTAQEVPSIGDGLVLATLASAPMINDEGAVLIAGTLAGEGVDSSNDGVLLTTLGESVSLAVREGQPAFGVFGGAAFQTLSRVASFNNAGDIAFGASMLGPGIDATNNSGIWVSGGQGTDRLVAREGQAPDPNEPGVVFATLGHPVINGRGDVAFTATLGGAGVELGSGHGLFIAAPNGHISEVARTGDEVEVAPGDVRTVRAIGFAPGRESDGGGQFNDSGVLLYQLWFTDRTEALLTATVTCGSDFDASGVVAVPDIFAYLSAWFAQDARAEWDGAEGISVPDIFAFLTQWFGGC